MNTSKDTTELLSRCALCKHKFGENGIVIGNFCGIPGTY